MPRRFHLSPLFLSPGGDCRGSGWIDKENPVGAGRRARFGEMQGIGLDRARARVDKLAAPPPSESGMIQRFRVPAVLFVSVALLAGCHHANRPEAASPIAHAPYVRAGDFEYKALLPGPPADGSPAP